MRSIFNRIIDKNKFFLQLFVAWIIFAIVLILLFSDKQIFYFVNQHHTLLLDYCMTSFSALGRGESVAIVFLSLFIFKKYRTKKYLIATILFGILTTLISFFIKGFYNRLRPLSFFHDAQIHTVPWLENLYSYSFPSGHTMGAFGFFLMLNYFLPSKNKWQSFLLFSLALCTAYSRLYLGQHFFTDVIGGSAIGIIITLFILIFVKKYFEPK